MPPFRKVRPLRSLTAESVAKRLHKTLVYLDSIWNPTPNISPGSTPTNSPSVSPMVSPIGGRSTAGTNIKKPKAFWSSTNDLH